MQGRFVVGCGSGSLLTMISILWKKRPLTIESLGFVSCQLFHEKTFLIKFAYNSFPKTF